VITSREKRVNRRKKQPAMGATERKRGNGFGIKRERNRQFGVKKFLNTKDGDGQIPVCSIKRGGKW